MTRQDEAGVGSGSSDIPVRRFRPLDERPIEAELVYGDPIMSHAVGALSGMFPNGEDFFVQSVRHYRDQLDDPELRERVKQFVGQESTHERAHRDLNERLAGLGYKTRVVDWSVGIGFNQVSARVLPPPVKLAITAALEHYTATFAEVLLDDPEAQSMIGDEQVRRLLLWHALEESEHKAVAFDVYQAVVGNTFLRRAVMDAMTPFFLGGLLIATTYSALSALSPGDVGSYARSLARLPKSPFFSLNVLRRIRRYNQDDFHPSVFDATTLIDWWRSQLFPETTAPNRA